MDISGVYCIVNGWRYASTDPQETLFPLEGPYGLVRAIIIYTVHGYICFDLKQGTNCRCSCTCSVPVVQVP